MLPLLCATAAAGLGALGIARPAPPADDPLRLGVRRAELQRQLPVAEDCPRTEMLCNEYASRLAPLEPAIWLSEYAERPSAIVSLAKELDALEDLAVGPMLAGPHLTRADAALFPCVAMLDATLPKHFGWTEWTEEALFYQRPRLHAWWEMMLYEPEAVRVAQLVRDDVDALAITWGVDVPTAKARGVRPLS